eukprot:366277-Chlamydomonas_euryale.AAC.2
MESGAFSRNGERCVQQEWRVMRSEPDAVEPAQARVVPAASCHPLNSPPRLTSQLLRPVGLPACAHRAFACLSRCVAAAASLGPPLRRQTRAPPRACVASDGAPQGP